MEIITSEHNPLLKDVRKASSRGGLTSQGYAVAEGFHLLDEALGAGLEIGAVVVSESRVAGVEIDRLKPVPRIVKDSVFNSLSSTETPQGVLSLVRLKEWSLSDTKGDGAALILVLDEVQDPGNAGAMARAAEAFGASGIVFLKGSVHAHNPKCLRGSAGSLFRLPFVERVEGGALHDFFEENGIVLYAAEGKAEKALDQAVFSAPCAIAIGSEGRGISSALGAKATMLRIPTVHVESLNASVAAGVMLYEASRQRRAK
jgi:TrmH family RNA methyltransferase